MINIRSVNTNELLRSPAVLTALVSLLFSVIVVINDDSINSDGIRYIEAARIFLEQGLQASYQHYSWMPYQLLIAVTSKVTFLDLERSAYLINALFLAGLGYAFVRCSEALGGNRRVAFSAAIIFLTHLTVSGYRDLIVRDFGYWCFFFTAFLMLLRYQHTHQQKYAILLGLSLIIATLFRVEGIVFSLLAPLILFKGELPFRLKLHHSLLAWAPILLLAVLSGSAILLMGDSESIRSGITRFEEYAARLITIPDNIVAKGDLLKQHVLSIYARNMGTESMLAILLMMLVVKLLSAVSLVPLLFTIRSLVAQKIRKNITYLTALYWFGLVNLVVLVSFLLLELFLSSRYAVTFGLLLCLPAAFALAALFSPAEHSVNKKPIRGLQSLRAIVVIVFVYLCLDGITSFSAGKVYRREAASWIVDNIPNNAKILSNDESMYYYTKRFVPWEDVKSNYTKTRFSQVPQQDLIRYDVVVLHISRKQKNFENTVISWLGLEPVYQTENSRGDKVVIFNLK